MWLVRKMISVGKNPISSAMVAARSHSEEEHRVVVIRNVVARHSAEK